MKDCFDFKPGWVTTFGGIRAMRNYVAKTACTFVERMENAGAIVVGKTNSPIFGFRGTCDNYLFGPSRNPFDFAKNTGGSSGGGAGDGGGRAAAAVPRAPTAAARSAFPPRGAACSATRRRSGACRCWARPNAFGGTAPFMFEGPITRTVEDAALAMTALAGYDSRDLFAIEAPSTSSPRRAARSAGKRIAYTRDYGIFPVDPEVRRVVDRAVRAFEEAGAHVEEVDVGIRRSQRELSDCGAG